MPTPEKLLELYLHLARASERRQRAQSDKFLVLAAGMALRAGFLDIAEDCRRRVLERNPTHLLGRYANMRDAARSDEVRLHARQLSRIYPFEKAEYLLDKYRAGGYAGGHGYAQLSAGGLKDAHPTKTRKRPRRSAAPSGREKDVVPRPALQQAFSDTERRSALGPGNADSDETPFDVPHRPMGMGLTPAALACWFAFAVCAGIAIGACLVLYLRPGG